MTRLFWKIFFWFWGSMIVIGLALYFVVLTARPEVLPRAWRQTAASSLAIVGGTAVNTWEKEGAKALASTLALAGQRSQARYWLFDSNRHELSTLPDLGPENLPPPRGIFGLPGIGGPPPGAPPDDGPPEMGERFEEGGESGKPSLAPEPNRERVIKGRRFRRGRGGSPIERVVWQAFESDTPQFDVMGPDVIGARRLKSSSGKIYVVAGIMHRPDFGRSVADPQVQLLGGLFVLLLSGGICFGLVRYLTSPLIVLRQATNRLAGGDLGARTHAASRNRRDEVADLGRDFDAMAERLEAMVGSQQRLLGDISHELRSPLARMNMALALSRRQAEGLNGGEALSPSLDRIGRESKRLDALIAQLLDVARLDSGEVEATEMVALDQVVREVVADAHFEAEATGRAVRLVQTAPFSLPGDVALLRSAVENVVRNAVRYTAAGTAVEVSLVVAAEAIIRVRDHGPGVPEEALSQLFTPFYRVETARDRNSGGVGLGLAITKRAVLAHGGHVEAVNAPRGGLEITLTLPESTVRP